MNTAARRGLQGARTRGALEHWHRERPLRVYFSALAFFMGFFMRYTAVSRQQGSVAALDSEALAMLSRANTGASGGGASASASGGGF